MTPMIKNLLWKEFHELKSASIAATVVTLSIPLSFAVRAGSSAFEFVVPIFFIYPLLASIFFGMRAAAGERTNRIGSFIAALPVSYRVLGAIRLAAISIAAAVPLLALLVLAIALCFHRSFVEADVLMMGSLGMPPLCALSILATTGLLSIVAAAGTGQPTEIRAGAVGILGLLGLWFLWASVVIVVLAVISAFRPDEWGPGYQRWAYTMQTSPLVVTFLAIVFLIIFAPTVFMMRYGRTLGPFDVAFPDWQRLWSWKAAAKRIRTGLTGWRTVAPGSSVWTALLWKASREMVFVGISVLVASLGLAVLGAFFDPLHNSVTDGFFEIASKSLFPVLGLGGFVLAILIGVGAVIGDVQPGINTFWRSRPIAPAAWYWSKYLVGLVTILLAVGLPALLSVGAIAVSDQLVYETIWLVLAWGTTFSFALTATCLVRQPLQAAILAVGAAGLLFAGVNFVVASGSEEPGPLAVPAFIVAFALGLIVSTLLGAWAVEHDVAIS